MKTLRIEKSLMDEYLVDRYSGTIGKIEESCSYFGNQPVTNSHGDHVGDIVKTIEGGLVFKGKYSCLPPSSVTKGYSHY